MVAIAVGSNEEESASACISRSLESYEGGDAIDALNALDYFTFTDKVTKSNASVFGTVSGSDVISTSLKNYKEVTVGGNAVSGLSTAKNGVHVDVNVKKDQKIKVTLYLGARKSTAVIMVTDRGGNILARESLKGGSDGAFAKFSFVVGSRADQTLRVDVVTTERDGNGTSFVVGGNAVLSDENVHDYVIAYEKPGNCIEDGVKGYECSICGDAYEVKTGKGEHDYEDKVVAPTCTEKGYTEHVCKICGDNYKDTETDIAAHEYDIVTTLPTCEHEGFDEYYCVNCGKTEIKNVQPIIDHTPGNWILDKQPSCVQKGSRHKECSMCGKTLKSEELALSDHIYGNWRTDKPSTCTEKGSEKRICSTCGKEEIRNLALIAHDYEDTVVPATCKQEGCTKHTCKVCGDSYEDNRTAKLEHTWDEGVITLQPTTSKEGKKTFTCLSCGETKTETVAKLAAEEKGNCGSCKSSVNAEDMPVAIAGIISLLAAAAFVLKRGKNR